MSLITFSYGLASLAKKKAGACAEIGDIIELSDEWTCVAADVTAAVKILIFPIQPNRKYRVESFYLVRKNSVYAFFSAGTVGFYRTLPDYRSIIQVTLVPIGQTSQATVPIAAASGYLGYPVPEGALAITAGFLNPTLADKVKAVFQVRVLN